MADKQPWRKEDEDEEEQELDENKDAILLAIDVSKSMLEPPPPSDSKKADRDSPVQAALKCAYHLMQQRIISNPKDMMGILLFGTNKSKFKGSVDDRSGLGYPHCYLFTDLDVPAAEDVQALKTLVEDGEDEDEILTPSDEPVSMSNLLFCANQIFTTKAANFGSRRLFIVTDNDNPHGSDKQAKSAAAVRAKDLYDLGILIDLFPITRGDEKFDLNKFYDDVIYRDPIGEANMTEVLTSKSGDGLTLLNSLISNVNSKQTVKRALFSNLPFEIAPGLCISVKGYNIVHRQTPARTCYIWLDGEKPQIAAGETTRIAEDSARTVEKAEIKKAYKFGGEYVYFSPDEQKSLKDFGSPVIRIIGFKPRSLLPVWASTKKSTFIFPSEEDYVGSTRVFTALWRKLLKDDKMGVAWCITRANAQPMLAAIIPSRERSDDGSGTPYLPAGLWIYPLPFQDDLRNINPPSEVLRSSGELTTQMRTIIQQLQLPKAMYDPLKYPNPALQWHYRILQALALEEEVPEKADDATEPKYKAISKRAGGYLEEWSESLEEESGKVANRKSTKRETDDEDMERPAKKSRGSSEKATGSPFTPVSGGSQWRGAQVTPTKSQLNTPRPLTSSIKSVAPPSPTCAFVSPQTPGQRRPSIPSATLVTSSPQKEPGADEYNSRLLRLARRRPTCEQRRSMADFLASLGLGGAQTPAASSNSQCDSVEELQLKLRSILDAKATPTRAEHVALTIELRATVRFQLPVSESENGTLESLNNIDPSLGGTQSVVMNGNRDEGQLSRVVFANDTIMNQLQDDPTIQRSVAKHIISIISSTDGSTWTVREVSRGTQGWTFTYLCKDSYQQWTRQNAKNQTKAIVGEFSQREPDPVLHARPAFDCRGSITIAFNRGSRSITVKYDHTSLHKTVAELAAYFKPTPRQLGPGAQRLLEQQQKAKERTLRKPRGEKKHKKDRKKRDSTVKAQDENGNPRKRKKKNNGVYQPADSVDGPLIPSDYSGATAIDGQNQGGPLYMNGGETSGNTGQQGFNDYPQRLMGDATTNGSSSQQANGQMASVAFPVNVSAAEAARRKEAATTMLSNAGVDPTTLSPEQFGIFANQAPELQRESLSMLVKYGAERLRIVHPGNKEGSTQASSSTQSSQTTSTGPRTTKELVPQSSSQSNANTDTETALAQAADDTSTPKCKRKKMVKSRTACFPLPEGETNLHRMTTKAKKSEAIVVDDDDDDDGDGEEEDEEAEQQEDAEGEGSEQEDDEQQDTSQDYSYPQMNIGNMVTNTDATTQDTQSTQSNYYQPASGQVPPQPDPYSASSQAMSTSVPQRGNYSHNLSEVTQPIGVHPAPPVPAPAGTIAPSETRRWTAFGSGSVGGSSTTSKTRRSLPSEPSQANAQNMPANTQPSDWAQTSNTTMPATTMASVSPQMTYDTRSSARTRKNQSLTNDTPQQAAAVPNTVMQQAQARQSPVAAAAMMAQTRKSPYQQAAVPRTTSRTSQRNQSRTPVTDQARGYQPPSDMTQQQSSQGSTHYDTSHMSSGSGYNDYGRYSSTSTSGSHQPPNSMSTSYQNTPSTANQWSNSSSRNDRSYGTNPSYQTLSNIYAQTTASKPTRASRQNFNMRSNTQQHTRASSGSYNQQQPQQQQQQGYASYSGSAHQSQQAQTSNQQQPPSWYFQNSHNPSVHPGGQSSGYNYEPWSGV
ncbi:ATP-dependent DNA helicase 2 subunit 1 [Fusarium sp. NRRL 52700]|nr:ATP-dependent DNA helicase 2 subunit 1 [Fusarium sp. NRRL 52700]